MFDDWFETSARRYLNSTVYAFPGSSFKFLPSSAARIHSCEEPMESRHSDCLPESASAPDTAEIFAVPLSTYPENSESPPSKSSENKTSVLKSEPLFAESDGAGADVCAVRFAEDSESDGTEAPPSQAESAAKHAAAHNVIELLVFMRINIRAGNGELR